MLPDARTQTLPELDHLTPLTSPADLASTIGAFVRHPAATASWTSSASVMPLALQGHVIR
jgi:hypothetical protein